jgi:tetraacyldisaccharide 4'-kinase
MKRLEYYWYLRSPWMLLLTPLSLLFRMAAWLRRSAYRIGLLSSHRLPVPVIVVGNITVGGTGKTPLVAWIANHLKHAGYNPGVVSRGYRGKAGSWPQQVRPDSDPAMVGDEAVLLAGICNCPMSVAPNRVAAASALIEHNNCDIIVSDDGLQHYALQRDVEIAVVDGVRRYGNGLSLPAGPLREPLKRLTEVDMVVVNGLGSGNELPMTMKSGTAIKLIDAEQQCELSEFHGQTVHAIAAIGNPERFFVSLRQAGMLVKEHAFPDHYFFRKQDISFDDDLPVLMTGKDAVKCRRLASGNHWYVPVTVTMTAEFPARLQELLEMKVASVNTE